MVDPKLEKVALALLDHQRAIKARVDSGAVLCVEDVTLTYAELSAKAGVATAQSVSAYLNRLAQYSHKAASLDCLVVAKRNKRPSAPKFASGWSDAVHSCIPGLKTDG